MGILKWLFGTKTPTTEVLSPEDDNLLRWRMSGQPRAWIEKHQGQWGHEDWLELLDELRQSSYWPMHPDAIGMVLEETRQAMTAACKDLRTE